MKRRIATILTAILAMVSLGFVAPSANAQAASGSRTLGYIYSDWYYGGFARPIFIADYGDCDYSGYRVSDTWGGSLFRQTSSISNSSTSPGCNYVIITTTYGGRIGMRIPTVYVGDAANDQVQSIQFVRR